MSDETTLPSVSVVVPTYRRRDNLTEVVLPLLEDPSLLELLVVVDGCEDGSLELLEQLAETHPRLRPIWTENSGGAAARQTGIDAAVGEVLLLLDDDVVAAPGLVTGHARRHQEADDLVVLGYMPTRPPEPGARGRFATHLYAQEYESVCQTYEADPTTVLLRLWGGNVSVRREHLVAVPYHSGPFARSNHSDRDFGLRLKAAGLRGVFDRSLLSSHEHVRPLEAFLRDARRQGAGRALVHVEHAELLGPLPMEDTLQGLPGPLRAVVRLDRFAPLRAAISAVLLTVARLASRAGITAVEVGSAKVLRRFETRRGIREVIPTA
ncbi:glycosyltransferase family 2 protein [Actinotalea sp. C106]|uniref:glycosyltransferase n=1 Tax=Actinotalea sp. C106 TaxID=2908644 RepID=UPI002028BC5F|nr:glycosyltransferase family 2 protein [Actinotalea sp. C106]